MNTFKKFVFSAFIALAGSFLISTVEIKAQNYIASPGDITIEIELSQALEQAQVLSLSGLGLNTDGSGPDLLSGFLENLSDKFIDNLYFEIKLSSGQYGSIATIKQQAITPFSLDPFQTIYLTNNDLANENIPGIDETIKFTGDITPSGDDLINSLEGSTSLPADNYTVSITLFQVTNQSGRVNIATSTTQIGRGKIFEAQEIYLRAPGDVQGNAAEITNPYPQFSWEGEADTQYRLIVVQADPDNVESRFQVAQGTPATNNSNGNGQLQQFENLDVLVTGDTFQFPASGATALVPGTTYYWRVSAELQAAQGTETRNSEIWNFTLLDTESELDRAPVDREFVEGLVQLIGLEEYEELTATGFYLHSVEMNNQTVTGLAATQLLEEIIQKIRDGEIVLGDN